MRYAAKRTWPDRPPAWEQHGEAENLEAFALAFATERRLALGNEFEVLDKDSDDAALVGFRVTGTDPYRLAPPGSEASGSTDGHPPPPPFAVSAMGFFFYMAKTALILMVIMGGIMFALKYLNLTPPPG